MYPNVGVQTRETSDVIKRKAMDKTNGSHSDASFSDDDDGGPEYLAPCHLKTRHMIDQAANIEPMHAEPNAGPRESY